jgi:hypothetical protein
VSGLLIDRLTLDGFSPADREALVAALRRELARLLEERGGNPGAWNARSIPAVEADLAPGDSPETAGAAIARALHGALGGGER